MGDNHLDGTHIANNRLLHNGGSNLAGAVGIFNGAYGYEVNNNDLCGNFSAEYGGGISHFGLAGNLDTTGARAAAGTVVPSIYFNGSYDEGAGVIIAEEPPLSATVFGAGAGPVNIYNNLIEANLANDDGGGLRFLGSGNFPYNVYNNIIVNNISAHEGGGVAIDNAPNVRFYNNTVMKNLTTATAATSNGQPAPAGLSTALNNSFLQATLPAGSPLYSNPLMFNNIFYDNRAGSWDGGNIVGIGGQVWSNGVLITDPSPINHWDMGVPGTSLQLSPTNSVLQSETVNHNDVVASPTNKVDQDPVITTPYDTTVMGLPWRGNPNFVANTIVAQDVPVTIMGDYHLKDTTSSAFNAGAASKTVPAYQQPPSPLAAPAFDIDSQARPALGGFDSGADEYPGLTSDLAITKTDNLTSVNPGAAVTYTITVSNIGPNVVTGAAVTDNISTTPLTGVTWSCVASAGSSCGSASGTGSISTTVTLPVGGSATFTLNGTVATNAAGTLTNTATVTAPASVTDPSLANNTAVDHDTINILLPTLTLLDNFNRANATTLNNGANWSQVVLLGSASIRVNTNQAFCPNTGIACLLGGQAFWNNPTAGFSTTQGAAFTFANTTLNNAALILKATGGSATVPGSFVRVRYNGGQVFVETTTTSGLIYTSVGSLTATFTNGQTLTAVANADGSVDVWQNTTYVGRVTGTGFTGAGRIGLQLPSGGAVDNFLGGNTTALVSFNIADSFFSMFLPVISNK